MAKRQINLAAMTPAQAARVLNAVSEERVTAAQVKQDVDAGAPVNDDGTLHLVNYGAWLHRQVRDGQS